MDKNSQKTLGNSEGRKLEPARYLNKFGKFDLFL